METMVVEEKVFDSKMNIRDELIDIKKAFPISCYVNSTFTLMPGELHSIPSCSFCHFHSNANLDLDIRKEDHILNINSQLITLDGKIDEFILRNNSDSNITVYITYAC